MEAEHFSTTSVNVYQTKQFDIRQDSIPYSNRPWKCQILCNSIHRSSNYQSS